MANFCLTDPMNPAKPLFQPVWIPRQVVIDHKVRALKINSFTRSICCNQNLRIDVLLEPLSRFVPLLPTHRTVYFDYCLVPTNQLTKPARKIIERVTVLRKYDQLPTMPLGVLHVRVVL